MDSEANELKYIAEDSNRQMLEASNRCKDLEAKLEAIEKSNNNYLEEMRMKSEAENMRVRQELELITKKYDEFNKLSNLELSVKD